jgi:hypothetical protein
MRMTDLHEVAYDAAADVQTFDLVSLLQLPAGRMTVSRVRWRLVPMDPQGGAVGSRVRPVTPVYASKLGLGGTAGGHVGVRNPDLREPADPAHCGSCTLPTAHTSV